MKNILSDRQIAVLEAVGREQYFKQNFYLTGGTPLAALYLQHRYSEDLDFFSEQEVDASIINVFFEKNRKKHGIRDIDFQQSFNRNLFFLHFKDEILKTEFTYFPFPRISKGPVWHGVSIDSLIDIAVNKLFTIYQRTQARDYIDLYCICKKQKYSIPELKAKAKEKFDWHIDPLQLGAQFLKAAEAPDLPRMLIELPSERWQNFFLVEAKKLKRDILK